MYEEEWEVKKDMNKEEKKATLDKGMVGYQLVRKTKLEANTKKRIFAYMRSMVQNQEATKETVQKG